MFKKSLLILSLLILFVINSCKETINEPCGDDIKITIITKYNDCNGNCLPAEESNIWITQNSSNNTVLLDSGVTSKGRYTYSPISSGCGISNLFVTANFLGKVQIISFDYICKDTIIEICIPCDTIPPNDCNSLGKVDSLKFIDDNTGQECIPINSPTPNSHYFRSATYKNGSSENMIIRNLGSVLNYNQKFENGKFRFKLPATFAVNGIDYTLSAGNSITLFFEVKTNEVGKFTDKLSFPVVCQANPSNTAQWEINLLAEVCPAPCDCPFGPTKAPELAVTAGAENLKMNETKAFSNVEVLKINTNSFDKSCYLMINEIVRIDTNGVEYATRGLINNPYQINTSNPEDDWTITTLGPYENKIYDGGSLKVNVKVGNIVRKGYLRDTFKLKTTVYDKTGAIVDNNCEYKFYLEATVCEDVCADISLLSVNKGIFNEVNSNNLTDIWNIPQWVNPRRITSNETIQLKGYYNKNEIFCNFESTPSPDKSCGSPIPTDFNFSIQLPSNSFSCNTSQTYQFEKINPYPNKNEPYYEADAKYFNFKTGTGAVATISNNGSINLTVNFTAPTFSEWSSMLIKDPNKQFFRYRLSIRDAESDKDCHIVLNFLVKLSSFPRVGPIRMLYAYNQKTPKQPIPDSMAVKIDETHNDGFWGVDKNKVAGIGNAPNSDDSFFLNVANPSTNQTGQAPLLNLVPTTSNSFIHISVPAIKSYNSDDAFKNDYVNLINNTLFDANSCFVEPPSRLNNTFTGINGIQVNPGEVYAVWSGSTGGTCPNPCKLALIYVYEVNNGIQSPNQSDVSNIRYRIVYPINK